MSKFNVGDRVRRVGVFYSSASGREQEGMVGQVDPGHKWDICVDFDSGATIWGESKDLVLIESKYYCPMNDSTLMCGIGSSEIKTNKTIMSSLKSIYKNMVTPEPLKSEIKAGMKYDCGDWTLEGKELAFEWLMDKPENRDGFNTEVVQQIIAEQEKK